jgi:hypothetical protein
MKSVCVHLLEADWTGGGWPGFLFLKAKDFWHLPAGHQLSLILMRRVGQAFELGGAGQGKEKLEMGN